jgi:hypothetical protein
MFSIQHENPVLVSQMYASNLGHKPSANRVMIKFTGWLYCPVENTNWWTYVSVVTTSTKWHWLVRADIISDHWTNSPRGPPFLGDYFEKHFNRFVNQIPFSVDLISLRIHPDLGPHFEECWTIGNKEFQKSKMCIEVIDPSCREFFLVNYLRFYRGSPTQF